MTAPPLGRRRQHLGRWTPDVISMYSVRDQPILAPGGSYPPGVRTSARRTLDMSDMSRNIRGVQHEPSTAQERDIFSRRFATLL
jgi:hypothetical protein